MDVEQREFDRLQVRENAFAALGSDSPRVGRIMDISIGGSAVEYITEADLANQAPREMDIFLTGGPCLITFI